jgi:hypothetical protein
MNDRITLTCPSAAGRGEAAPAEAPLPRFPELVRIADVVARQSQTSSLTCIAAWVQNYLAQPHAELGRPGLVCPFVPMAVRGNSIWLAEIAEAEPSFDDIAATIMAYRDRFLELEPTEGAGALQKAIIVVFPTLAGGEGSRLVDQVQFALKKEFVVHGLMLGEFHADNESPGLRNEQFRPLRSPIPLLAIRHMVEADLPFLVMDSYEPAQRVAFLRAYLMRLTAQLKPAKFEHVLERLITEEVAVRTGAAAMAEQP